jgi:hypothetical protein
MESLKHLRSTAALWASVALLCGGCASSGAETPDTTSSSPADEVTSEAQENLYFYNSFFTLDNYAGWSWKQSYSFYYRRWIWNWCNGSNTGTGHYLSCYSDAPYKPASAGEVVNQSAPRPSGSAPSSPPPGGPR